MRTRFGFKVKSQAPDAQVSFLKRVFIRRGFILPFLVLCVVPSVIVLVTRAYLDATSWSLIASSPLFLTGVVLMWRTIRLFNNTKGGLAPWNPPERLIIKGPYRYVRNPMFVGIFLVLLSEAVALQSIPIAVWFAVFFTLMNLNLQFTEEPDLRDRFGDDYRRYCTAVSRWAPRFTPFELDAGPDSAKTT